MFDDGKLTVLICGAVLSDQAKRAMYNAGMLNLYENEDDEVGRLIVFSYLFFYLIILRCGLYLFM